MNRRLLRECLVLLFVVLPAAYLGWVYTRLPETVPMHYNLRGEPDRFGHKSELWLATAATCLPVYFILLVVPRLDPKRKIDDAQSGGFFRIRLAVQILMAALAVYMAHTTLTGEWLSPEFLPVGLGLLFTVLGNYLSVIRPNYFVGVRTPWTLESESVWRKTHRLSARMWFFGGLLLAVAGLAWADPIGPIPFIVGFGLLVTIPVVYSYIAFRREEAETGS